MSTKKIAAGDTLTVGDLTDDHLGAVIEVGPDEGITSRLTLEKVVRGIQTATVYSNDGAFVDTFTTSPVAVIAPPPVVQPDAPTDLGQMFRIEGLPDVYGFRVNPTYRNGPCFWWKRPEGTWGWSAWVKVKKCAGDRRIIVSDPPRWSDETPVVPERIEVGVWPDDDTHLRAWEWIDRYGVRWQWFEACDLRRSGWGVKSGGAYGFGSPMAGPWTRGERVE